MARELCKHEIVKQSVLVVVDHFGLAAFPSTATFPPGSVIARRCFGRNTSEHYHILNNIVFDDTQYFFLFFNVIT